MPVRIIDVAAKANVSSATVSRVLADKPYIRSDVRQRVMQAVKELGYSPSRVARSLRVSRSNTIGLVIADIENPFSVQLIKIIAENAFDWQYNVYLYNSDESQDKETAFIGTLLAENVAGVISQPVQETNNPINRLLSANIPVITIDRRVTDIEVDSISLNNSELTLDLVDHLVSDGHRQIGGIFTSLANSTGRERFDGYKQALKLNNLPFLPQIVRHGPPREQDGYRFAKDLLNLPEHPSALIVTDHLMATGVLRAIRELRLHIPGDIGLAVFSDSEWTALFEPAITVVVQPVFQIGRLAVELLFERIGNTTIPHQHHTLKGGIIIRHSCGHHGLSHTQARLRQVPEYPDWRELE
jgi:DNA-binding LacI/PurR family transcriptional regulator